jgi:tetratricopeptide (TPR) repeat protein
MSLKLEELVGKSITEAQFDEAAGKKDACYRKVKARYDVWPSAYASGALVKCRKVGAKNWGNKSKKESVNENTEKAVKDMINRGVVKKGQNDKDRVRAIGQWLDDRAHKISAKYNDNWIRRIKMGRGGQVQDWWGDTMSMISNRLRESVNKKKKDDDKWKGLGYDSYESVNEAINHPKVQQQVKQLSQVMKAVVAAAKKDDRKLARKLVGRIYDIYNDLDWTIQRDLRYNESVKEGLDDLKALPKDLKKSISKKRNESINEAGMELKKLEDAIKFFKKKIEKQGRVTNARDEEHLERLMKVYNDMGGRKIKENNESLNWLQEKCWKGYEKKGMKKMFGKMYPNCVKKESVEEAYDIWAEDGSFGYTMTGLVEAEYQGRKVKLGKPMQGDTKKFKVYVKNPKGNVVKVNFGQGGGAKGGTMKIRKSNPKARASFRARHNCDNPGPRHKARYWSCRKW